MANGIRMIITINEDKTATIDGPIGDKLIAYGMLEVGKDLIRAHHEQLALGNDGDGERIVAPSASAASLLELARLRGGG